MVKKKIAEKIPIVLSRTLGPFSITLLGIGALLGGGIFTLLGHAAGLAGPALPIAIIIGALIAFLNLRTYVSLTTTFPAAGGSYNWTRHGLGEFYGFLSGWISWFANAAACGLYAASFGFYVAQILGLDNQTLWVKSFTILIIIIFGFINYRGNGITTRAGNVVTLILLAILFLFITAGIITLFYRPLPFSNFSPFLPNGIMLGLAGIAQAAALFYIAFEGSEIQAQSAEEVKNPSKNLKKSLFYSWGIVSIIYLLISFVMIALTNWQFLGNAGEAATLVSAKQFMPLGGILMIIGGLLANAGALNATIYSSSHVSFAMGRDRVIFPFFGEIHPIYKTPYWAILISTFLILIMALWLPIKDIASAATFLFIALFFITNIAYIQLRRKHEEAKWKYLPKGFPALQLILLAAYIILGVALFQVSQIAAFVTIGWILLGIINFFAFSEPQVREDLEKEVVYEKIVRRGLKKGMRILVPLISETSWNKLQKLSHELGRKFNGEVIFLHIEEIPSSISLTEAFKNKQREQQNIDRVAFDHIDAHTIMAVSRDAVHTILETVHVEDCDLLILGWQGYKKTYSGKSVFGFKVDTILREANCDLLVANSEPPQKINKILIPISPSGNPHLRFVGKITSALATDVQTTITLLAVISPNPSLKIREWTLDGLRRAQFIMKINPALRIILKIKQNVSIEASIIEDSKKYDLILMPVSRGKLFQQIRFGNIPEIVARFSKTPVLLVKSHTGILPPLWSYLKERFF